MRLIKTFGLAAVTAVTAMAFLGSSSATAKSTAICKTNEEGLLTCAEANQWKKIHAVATDPVFLSNEGNVLCESSLLEVTLLELAAPQVGHNNTLTWTNCKLLPFGPACTVTTLALGTSLFLKTAANLGEMVFHGQKIGIKCGFGFECIYEGLPWFHLLGASLLGDSPSNGGFTGKESQLTSGPLDACPPDVLLDVFWEALEPVYIKS